MIIKQNTFQHKEGMVPNTLREAKIQSNTSETLDPNMANAMKTQSNSNKTQPTN